MRLGVLELGSAHPSTTPILDTLRTEDIDVVVAEAIVDSLEMALREAKRLSRADCDGILMSVGEGCLPEAMTAAALLLAGVPLLLVGYHGSSAFFEAVGTLESIGARFDRGYFINDQPNPAEYVGGWLRENSKKQRQRGREAVRKLYGQRLYVPLGSGSRPDPALWMHQFGIIVTAESEGADFAAPDGDACGALTEQLLLLASGETAASRVPIVASLGGTAEAGDTDSTFARITRTKGHFRCLLLRGALRANGDSARFDCPTDQLFASAASPWLHAVSGDHLGALRAACESLGIDAVILRHASFG